MVTVSKINYGDGEVRVAWDGDTDRWYLYVFNWESGHVTADPSEHTRHGRYAAMTDSGVKWVAKARTGEQMVEYLRLCGDTNTEYREVADEVAESIENDKG